MNVRYTLVLVAIIVLLSIASATAYAQSANSLDISIPSSFPLTAAKAYDSNYTTVDVWGNIDLIADNGLMYVSIPTNGPEGNALSFFQDTDTWALFRNNTLVLPVKSGDRQVANLVLATGDLTCANGRYYGPVTGTELDTTALNSENASLGAIIYLNALPERASYRMSLVEDDTIKNAILNVASKNDASGNIIKQMVEITGVTADSKSSIGYIIVKMNAGDLELNGNATAYRYYDGAVSRLPCKTIESDNGTVYEAISTGPGTFAFVGSYQAPPPIQAGLNRVLIFSGGLGVLLFGIVIITIRLIKRSSKN